MDPLTYRHAIDEYRAHWRFILPLSASGRVLDLSCGWGAVSFNLAEVSGLVVAADPCSEHVRFVAHRARQKGQSNIVPLQLGLDQPFPLFSRSFDAVVMVDALSWLPNVDQQRLILRRILKVLKPGGWFFLADANRLSCGRLLRRLSSGKSHTLNGYCELLHSVGFGDLRKYVLAPSHTEPFFILPFDPPGPFEFFLREIVAHQDFGVHFRSGALRAFFQMTQTLAQRLPAQLLASLARSFVASVAILSRT